MIDYLRHIKPFEGAHSDDDIAIYCNTLCNAPLPTATIRTICAASGVVHIDSSQKYVGPLVDFLFAVPAPLNKLALWFFQHVWMDQGESLSLDGNTGVLGVDGFTVVTGFGRIVASAVVANPAFGPLVTALVQSSGGFIYTEHFTAKDVEESRKAAQHVDEVALLRQENQRSLAERYNIATSLNEQWDGTGDPPDFPPRT